MLQSAENLYAGTKSISNQRQLITQSAGHLVWLVPKFMQPTEDGEYD